MWLVRNRFAFDWPQYSKGVHGPRRRRRSGQGAVWAGSFVVPRGPVGHVFGLVGVRMMRKDRRSSRVNHSAFSTGEVMKGQ